MPGASYLPHKQTNSDWLQLSVVSVIEIWVAFEIGEISHNLTVYPTLFLLPFISHYKERTDDDLELLSLVFSFNVFFLF